MKKIACFLLFVALMSLTTAGTALTFSIPTVEEDPNETITAVIETKGKPNVERINRQVGYFSTLTLGFVYKEVFNGYSLTGKRKELTAFLNGKENVQRVTDVQSYSVANEKSIEFIGTDFARGYLDQEGNRLTGKGIKVGIIDTGIDYTHPDLSRNYRGGHDLVDGDELPMETQSHEGLPTLHGTHVAGVIGANGKMRGVAPDVELYAYRALGPGGTGTTDQVLAAIDQAVQDKMDIINLSLGNNVNGPDLPISLALDRAVEKGVVAITSSGNSGPENWTVGTPGTSEKSISVGASTPPMKIPYAKVDAKKMRLFPLAGGKGWDLARTFQLADGRDGMPEQLKHVQGKIALIQRGGLTFWEKVNNAEKAGAVATIIYNNTPGPFMGTVEDTLKIPAASITKAEGDWLKQELKKPNVVVSTEYKQEKDLLAPFSSRGPVTFNWLIKPDISAPGVEIESTVPKGYMSLQGTSMASPHVAGVAALLLQAHPTWTPDEVKSALMLTAKPLVDELGDIYEPTEQGAGRVSVQAAMNVQTLVTPSSLSFGKLTTDRFGFKEVKIRVKNVSNQKKDYRFDVNPEQNHDWLRWEMPMSFSLSPQSEKEVTVRVVKTDIPSTDEALISGRIKLIEDSHSYELPYLFVIKEPDYPRIMGFTAVPGDDPDTLRYEVYLPGGAEEFGIALYDADTLNFLGFIERKKKLQHGMLEQQIKLPPSLKGKMFYTVAYVRYKQQEDHEQRLINWY
ncbi:S8 family serine peptidase [Bacillus sp. 2205SS5-2]|uniref:S8 family serine peptidase n=1 Tax=Bacillus sp. 2205SS5-2 TaxID=3109031 RepID=UPI003003CE64